jgi:hypothetical protein
MNIRNFEHAMIIWLDRRVEFCHFLSDCNLIDVVYDAKLRI